MRASVRILPGAPARCAVNGFTLVELVVVIALLTTIASVVGPAMIGRGDDGNLVASANRLLRLIRAARTAGLEQGVPLTLTVDAVNGRYVMERGGDSTAVPLDAGRLDLARDVTLAGDQPVHRFVFDRIGSAAAESLIVHGSGGTIVVGIESWTGEPYVRRLGVE